MTIITGLNEIWLYVDSDPEQRNFLEIYSDSKRTIEDGVDAYLVDDTMLELFITKFDIVDKENNKFLTDRQVSKQRSDLLFARVKSILQQAKSTGIQHSEEIRHSQISGCG